MMPKRFKTQVTRSSCHLRRFRRRCYPLRTFVPTLEILRQPIKEALTHLLSKYRLRLNPVEAISSTVHPLGSPIHLIWSSALVPPAKWRLSKFQLLCSPISKKEWELLPCMVCPLQMSLLLSPNPTLRSYRRSTLHRDDDRQPTYL
jgi:hypothetical protein